MFLLSYAVAVGDTVFIALQGYQLTAAMLICFFCKKYEGQLCEEHEGAEAPVTRVKMPPGMRGQFQGATLDDRGVVLARKDARPRLSTADISGASWNEQRPA